MRKATSLAVLAILAAVLCGPTAEAARKPPPPPPAPPPDADPAIACTTSAGSLLVMNADGSNQTTLLASTRKKNYNCHNPSWSPDGNWIAFFASYPEDGIYIIRKDGTGLAEVVAMNETGGYGAENPQWSPDGNYILYSDTPSGEADEDLFLVEAVAGADLVVNLTNTPDEAEFWPTWSPDGTKIAAQVYDGELASDGYPDSDVVVFDVVEDTEGNLSAVESVNLTDSGTLTDYHCFDVDWARTSDSIAVGVRPPDFEGYRDIWVITLDAPEDPVNLTEFSGVDNHGATWSPDDQRIAYTRDGELYVINSDGSSSPVRLATSATSLREPDWRHN